MWATFVTAPDLSGTIQQYDIRGIADTKRALAGQSPYLINAGVYYAAPNVGLAVERTL